jgi:DNA-binding FrmR family transcriptional regulator
MMPITAECGIELSYRALRCGPPPLRHRGYVYTENMSTVGYEANKERIQKRLRRIEGQVRGLERMVTEDRYCIDILDQVSSVTRALQGVALALLDDHLSHCVADALDAGGARAAKKVEEASAAIARMVKS